METIKSQVSIITQSVIDGETSACEAQKLLIELRQLIQEGLKAIEPEVLNEIKDGRVHKTDNESVTIPDAF